MGRIRTVMDGIHAQNVRLESAGDASDSSISSDDMRQLENLMTGPRLGNIPPCLAFMWEEGHSKRLREIPYACTVCD